MTGQSARVVLPAACDDDLLRLTLRLEAPVRSLRAERTGARNV